MDDSYRYGEKVEVIGTSYTGVVLDTRPNGDILISTGNGHLNWISPRGVYKKPFSGSEAD